MFDLYKIDADGAHYPSIEAVRDRLAKSFAMDADKKIRASLIDMGWCPPDVFGEFKAAFRANMLRRAQPGENIDAEIDRVFAALMKR